MVTLARTRGQFLKVPLAKQPCERLIVSPRRQIILEGGLGLLDSGKPVDMYAILFDDMFIITRRKKGLSKKVRTPAPAATITRSLTRPFSLFSSLTHNMSIVSLLELTGCHPPARAPGVLLIV